jgi:hypothetical protein
MGVEFENAENLLHGELGNVNLLEWGQINYIFTMLYRPCFQTKKMDRCTADDKHRAKRYYACAPLLFANQMINILNILELRRYASHHCYEVERSYNFWSLGQQTAWNTR